MKNIISTVDKTMLDDIICRNNLFITINMLDEFKIKIRKRKPLTKKENDLIKNLEDNKERLLESLFFYKKIYQENTSLKQINRDLLSLATELKVENNDLNRKVKNLEKVVDEMSKKINL